MQSQQLFTDEMGRNSYVFQPTMGQDNRSSDRTRKNKPNNKTPTIKYSIRKDYYGK